MSITVLSPVGINRVEAQPVAHRIDKLAGIRLGLINNNKPNAALLLEQVSGLIGEQHALAEVALRQKPHSSVGVEDPDGFAQEVQAAIVAVGD